MEKNIKKILLAGLLGVLFTSGKDQGIKVPSTVSGLQRAKRVVTKIFSNSHNESDSADNGVRLDAHSKIDDASEPVAFSVKEEVVDVAENMKSILVKTGKLVIAGVEFAIEELEKFALDFAHSAEAAIKLDINAASWTKDALSKEFKEGYEASKHRLGSLGQYMRALEQKLEPLQGDARKPTEAALNEVKRVYMLAKADVKHYSDKADYEARLLEYKVVDIKKL